MIFRLNAAIAAIALCVALPTINAQAAVFEITPDIQVCNENADCTAISGSCTKSCADVPVNTASVEKLSSQRLQTCGDAVSTLPACEMHPPLEPRCVNNRCTVGFAFDHTADDKDYGKKAGGKGSGKGAAASSGRPYTDGSGYLTLPEGYDGPAPAMAPRNNVKAGSKPAPLAAETAPAEIETVPDAADSIARPAEAPVDVPAEILAPTTPSLAPAQAFEVPEANEAPQSLQQNDREAEPEFLEPSPVEGGFSGNE